MQERHRHKALVVAMLFATSAFAAAYADTPDANNNKMNDTDSTFLKHAAQDGAATTQLAQLGVDKSSDPKVKQLAQQIVDGQNKSNDRVKALAQTKQVTLSTDADADAQKQAKQLQAKSGQAFDEAWSKVMVSDQQKAVKAFTQEGKDAKDSDVKKLAQDGASTSNTNLKGAQALAAVPAARDDAMSTAMKASTSSSMGAMPATMPGGATETPAESAAAADLKH